MLDDWRQLYVSQNHHNTFFLDGNKYIALCAEMFTCEEL